MYCKQQDLGEEENQRQWKNTMETRRGAARLRRRGMKERGSKVEACRERVKV